MPKHIPLVFYFILPEYLVFGERPVPCADDIELGHALCRLEVPGQAALLSAPLGRFGGGVVHIRKGGGIGRFRPACGVPQQHRQFSLRLGDGCAFGQQVVQNNAGGDLVAPPQTAAAPSATPTAAPPPSAEAVSVTSPVSGCSTGAPWSGSSPSAALWL